MTNTIDIPLHTPTRRRVEYRIYTGHAVSGTSTVSDLDVVMCESEGDALSLAVCHKNKCLEGAPFRKTVYVYNSDMTSDCKFGYIVCKTLEPRPEVFINLEPIDDLNSKKPISEIWLRRDSINADT